MFADLVPHFASVLAAVVNVGVVDDQLGILAHVFDAKVLEMKHACVRLGPFFSPIATVLTLDFFIGFLFRSQVTSGLGSPTTLQVTVTRSPSNATFKNEM